MVNRRTAILRVFAPLIALTMTIASCSIVGGDDSPDLNVVSGTAQVPESDNPLSLDQLWDPAQIDQTALFDFNLLPENEECKNLPSKSGKACFWYDDPNMQSASVILHTFSMKVSYRELLKRENFQKFRSTRVGGQPATFYTVGDDSEATVCNIGWGTPTGTTWVSGQDSGHIPNLCGVVQNWANSVFPYSREEGSQLPAGSPWRPDTLNEPTFLKKYGLANNYGSIRPDGPKRCATFANYIRSCNWQQDDRNARLPGRYEVRVSSATTKYDDFASLRSKNYSDHRAVDANGIPSLEYTAIPLTCNVAWPTDTGTAWVRVSLNDSDPEDYRDTCAIARKIASTAQNASKEG